MDYNSVPWTVFVSPDFFPGFNFFPSPTRLSGPLATLQYYDIFHMLGDKSAPMKTHAWSDGSQ